MQPSTAVWLAGITGVTAYEVWALRHNPDQLLSRALDRARATHPVANAAILAAIAATAGHLTRIVPPELDIFTLAHS